MWKEIHNAGGASGSVGQNNPRTNTKGRALNRPKQCTTLIQKAGTRRPGGPQTHAVTMLHKQRDAHYDLRRLINSQIAVQRKNNFRRLQKAVSLCSLDDPFNNLRVSRDHLMAKSAVGMYIKLSVLNCLLPGGSPALLQLLRQLIKDRAEQLCLLRGLF
jgi:hypothetical protein